MEKLELVIKTLKEAGKALKAGEVADLSGLPKAEVEKVFGQLKKEGKIVSPVRCFWELK